ncbi:MAG: phosphodiester glycosidase family protein [Synergistaceae bacterium]|nr:phosphodiester glycosidase family protein [Synergistaceae bacterium]
MARKHIPAEISRRQKSSGSLPKLLLSLFFIFLFAFSVSPAFGNIGRSAYVEMLLKARGFDPAGKDALQMALDLDLVPMFPGKPGEAVTMKEAIVCAVHSLGLSSAAEIMADVPLPFRDGATLTPIEKGSVAVAVNMTPPLLKKNAPSLGPERLITSGEAGNIAAIVKAASKKLSLYASYSPVKGMTIQFNRRGIHDRPPRWRGVVAGFETREEAELFSGSLEAEGVQSTVDSWNYDWRVRSPLFDVYGPVRKFLEAAEGLGRRGTVFSSPANWNTAGGPWFWVMITLDPAKFFLRPIVAPGGLSALAPLSSMTYGTSAAINGGYFSTSGKEKGAPIGVIIDRGIMANPPYAGRTILGWNDENQAAFGQMDWKAEVHFADRGYMNITGINKAPGEGAAILYTPHFGETTPIYPGPVAELVLEGSVCREVRRQGGNPIPPGMRVISVYGSPARHLETLAPGDRVEIRQTVNDGAPYWSPMTNAIQAGPFLLSKGVFMEDGEKLSDSVLKKRHPRSVIGLTEKGQWFFFVGDGRDAVHSVGFTLAETADILKKSGAYYALNLDGGGSSTISGEGRILNRLSDGKERPVSYGVGAFLR